MIPSVLAQAIFFIIVFVVFLSFLRFSQSVLTEHSQINSYMIIGVVFISIVVGVFYGLSQVGLREGFWDVSEFAKCKGGSYMWQGESNEAETCKALAESPAGRCGIASYNCPTGYEGTPMLPFYYTPMSNDSWENERCKDTPTCEADCPYNQGMCGMDKYVD